MPGPERPRDTDPDPARPDEFHQILTDLTALSALPGTWHNLEPAAILDSAAAALAAMLETDLLYICLWLANRRLRHEIAYGREGRLAAGAMDGIRTALLSEDARRTDTCTAPIGTEGSLIVAKASRRGFSGDMQQLLLTLAANEIAAAVHRWDAAADERRLASLIDRARDFMGVADMAGKVDYVNPAGLALVGYDPIDPASPPNLFDFVIPDEEPRLRATIMPEVVDRGRWVGEVALRDFRTQASIPVLLDWFRIDHPGNGQPMNFAAVISDLRPQKENEQRLRDVNDSLEQRVAERTRELAEANASLSAEMEERRVIDERLDLLQVELFHASRLSVAGQLAGTIAHELSQPLAAVINSVNATRRLVASGAGASDVALRELIEDAGAQAERAGEIVRRLRYFITRGTADRVTEAVRPMIEEAVAFAATGPNALGASISFYFDPGAPAALVDRVQIQQVVANLVRNALEAMKDSARRDLTITTNALDGMLEVAVADTGPGVAEEMIEGLFQPFMSTRPGGMGLGLSVCRSIVDTHGGRIDYEPRKGGGALFRFTLEAAPPEASPREGAAV
jgi:PAS domain S-box-containing protein